MLKIYNMQRPELGFYYHYKHDPDDIYNHAYEIVNISRNTETEEYLVVYRPFYKLDFLEHADASARPLSMFIDTVTKDGKVIPRFQKITDPKIIKKLEEKKKEMYP